MNDADPVEEFFARERRDITPAPGDEAHWTALVETNRRTRRARWTGFAAGAAAAVVLVGGVGYLLRPGDGTTALPASQTSSVSSSGTPSGSASRPTTGAPTTPQTTPPTSATTSRTTTAVSADFRLASVSQAGQTTIFGLGTSSCSGRACTQVVRSLDSGRTWRAVATFGDGVDAAGRTSSGKVGTDSTLTDIRMANPKVGWAFGGGLKMTTDGGFTWSDYPHEGKAVVALETDAKQVVIVSAGGDCNGRTCGGDLYVQRAAVGESAPTTVGRLSGGRILGATVAFADGQAVVSPDNRGATDGGDLPSVVTDQGLQTVTLPGCSATAGPATVVTPADGRGHFGFCASGGAAGRTGYAVSSSADGGRTWTQVDSASPLLLVNGSFSAFAAADAAHLLAVSGGDPAVHGSLKVSSDGGRTWADPASPPPMPDRGWAWAGAPGAGMYYAVPAGGSGSFWKSTDDGQTWRQVRVAG